jgi:hypothetical protein
MSSGKATIATSQITDLFFLGMAVGMPQPRLKRGTPHRSSATRAAHWLVSSATQVFHAGKLKAANTHRRTSPN